MYKIIQKFLRIFICICFFNLIQIYCALAKDLTFQHRISKIHNFYSYFKQDIIDELGILVQSSIGEIKIKQPGWFNWYVFYPNKIKIISNAKTIWIHDFLTNQVNIFFVKDIIKNTPFVLFTKESNNYFKNYNVFRNKDCFTLFPKDNIDTIKYCTICINNNKIIEKVIFVEKNGAKNIIRFYNQILKKFDSNQFVFRSFPGLTVDDERL
ncbi:MAG: outer membrane lipoprotein chaperone LolA [Buchnera aphidicola (Schlechtendalia peitan)]